MLRYTLIFAGLHFPIALSLGWLVDSFGWHPGVGVGIGVIFCVAGLVGWLFVRRHKRLFTKPERWRLIIGCLVYMILFECFGLWGMSATLPALSPGWWSVVAIYTVGLDFLALWICFHFGIRRMMRRQLGERTSP